METDLKDSILSKNEYNNKKNIILISNLEKIYENGKIKVNALNRINLEVLPGDFLVVSGQSGSGKSTLLNIIGCLDTPTSGEYLLDDEIVSNLNLHQLAKIRNEKIGFIFQSFHLIPVLNVIENIELPIVLSNRKFIAKELRERSLSLCENLGLKDHTRHKPDELSGGQRQRVAIARSLITNPKLIVADEPTANLDSKTANQIISLMIDLNKKDNVTFIFATHDPFLKEIASRVVQIKDGVNV